MNEYLSSNPLLLLFVVAALGYLLGNIKIAGTGLGTSAVLFVGLFFGALNPSFSVPDIIFQLGIIFFIYSVGLRSGPAFFQSFKKNGLRDFTFVIIMLTISALVTVAMYFVFEFDKSTIVGLYSGSSTNTTALASVIDMINREVPIDTKAINHLVVAYTFSYPMGVLGVMIAIRFMAYVLKIDYDKEKYSLRKDYPVDEDINHRTILISNPTIKGKRLRDIIKEYQWNIVFGRIDSKVHGVQLPHWEVVLQEGDKVIIVGTEEELDQAQTVLGIEAPDSLSYDRKEFDIIRIFVSNPELVGRELSSLNLQERFTAIMTRIRRGDVEMLAKSDTILELGDRIRFVVKRSEVKELQQLFGDSYYASSKIDIFSFGLGIAFGLILGMIEFSLPGGISFKLGYAGGPLLVGLFLGTVRRTGPIVWTLPYGSQVTLNQVGLTMLLAVVGIQSGNTMLSALSDGAWVSIFLAGTIVSITTALLSLYIGYKLVRIPFSLLLGFVSNQPAILDFATDISKNRIPAIGYSFMFPIALILKILFAQVLYLILT